MTVDNGVFAQGVSLTLVIGIYAAVLCIRAVVVVCQIEVIVLMLDYRSVNACSGNVKPAYGFVVLSIEFGKLLLYSCRSLYFATISV